MIKLMLRAGLVSAVLAFVSPLAAQADLMGDDLCGKDAGSTQECVSLLLKFRCHQYAFPIPFDPGVCKKVVNSFVATMKFSPLIIEEKKDDGTIVKNTVYVIFPQELERLLAEPAALAYLADLDAALTESFRTEGEFDLYAFTLGKARGDRRTALRWLAVLLQDTTHAQSHVRHLNTVLTRRGRPPQAAESRFMQLLESVNRRLQPDVLMNEYPSYADWLTLYPNVGKLALPSTLHTTIYHFYPMAYVAMLLEQAGIATKRFASFIPFLFNAEYEFREFPGGRWPIQHPLPFALDAKMSYTVSDIYTGYVGALFGIDRLAKATSFPAFATTLAKDPFGAMQDLYWTQY